jgi:hypothetical protein
LFVLIGETHYETEASIASASPTEERRWCGIKN